MTLVSEIAPDTVCDRCGHASRRHAVPTTDRIYSGCLVVSAAIPYGQKGRSARAKQCWCDLFVPKP